MRQCPGVAVIFFVCYACLLLFAQSPTATINGQVRDTTGALVLAADVQLINELTYVKYPAQKNGEGVYSIVSVPPGRYPQVSKAEFKTLIQSSITRNVLDARPINFELSVGAVSEIVTVEAGTSLTTVSSVVDWQITEKLPINDPAPYKPQEAQSVSRWPGEIDTVWRSNKEALLDRTSYFCLLLIIGEVMYKKCMALVLGILKDLRRIPPHILNPLAWLSLGALIAAATVQLFSK